MSSTLTAGAGVGSRRRGDHEWIAALCRRYLRRFGPAFATHPEAYEMFRAVRRRRNLHSSTWRSVQVLLCDPDNFLVFINRTLYQLDKKRAEHVYKLIKDVRPTQLYRHFDKHGCLLYVGISLSTVARLAQHKRDAAWFSKITRIEIEHFPNLGAALHAERKAIKTEAPIYNKSRIAPEADDPLTAIAKLCKEHAYNIDGVDHWRANAPNRR